jgi:hypothetical protein
MSRTSVLQFDPGQGCALRFLLAVAVSVGQTEQQLMIGRWLGIWCHAWEIGKALANRGHSVG